MFTQCPECSTAFRVTAKVLQQAGGRVRCGGCGHAFSALEHLSEEQPGAKQEFKQAAATAVSKGDSASDLTSEEKFKETSKQLLQTLSELTGADEVRIEDTGIEWHVVDEDDVENDDEDATISEDEDEASAKLEALVSDDEDSGDFLELEDDDESADDGLSLETDDESADWNASLSDDEDTAAGDDIPLEVEEELAAIHSELSSKDDPSADQPDDLGSQFENQAEAMGIDISGSHAVVEEDQASADESGSAEPAEMEIDAALADELSATDESAEQAGDDVIAEDAADDEETVEADEDAAGDDEDVAAAFTPDADVIELSLAGNADEQVEPEYHDSHEVPEPSPEEMTINQEIDQELLAIASQDDDLRATIVGLDSLDGGAKDSEASAESDEPEEEEDDEDAPGVETIIMEGDQIRGAFEREREQEKREAALKRFDKAGNLIDSYVARRIVRSGGASPGSINFGMLAGVILLILSLLGQAVHANRQALSTSDLFNTTVGQIYRLLGNPITPEWSITGWQFEATNGSIADEDDVLTIYSRIGNRSEQPLPFPLVHVSLTDRWEEIIGSAILEPGEYLAADQNPNQLVNSGGNFTAVITIDEPSVDATGFKLNVCYRMSPGRVRCATEDFKD
ncbi:MAG: DUF3426 domain-containing protein [Woeseiaceae bacterium]|nr:DUF3426 domain-containing protein [Woeseiaceae bacterium]